jgi:hypothetical protein
LNQKIKNLFKDKIVLSAVRQRRKRIMIGDNYRDIVASNKLPEDIKTNFLVIPSYFTVSEAQVITENRDEEYAVLENSVDDDHEYYLILINDFKERLRGRNYGAYVKDMIELKEKDKADVITLTEAVRQLRQERRPSKQQVVMDEDVIVGLIECVRMTDNRRRETFVSKPGRIEYALAQPTPPLPSPKEHPKDLCNVSAEMPEEAVIRKEQSVCVKISRGRLKKKWALSLL